MRIRDRPKAGAWLGFALSVLFAGIMVPLTTFDLWSGPAVDAAGRAVFTVRLPDTALWHDTLVGTRIEHRRLQASVHEALRNNYDLQTAVARVEQARALRGAHGKKS